ncbi:MAG: hypothetical protein AB8B97_13945 [Granulosicoccus sp.]
MHHSLSIKGFVSAGVLVGMITLTACGTTPKREPYAGIDQVGEINADNLVGNWKIRILNPISGEDRSTVTTNYNSDGTWTSVAIPPPEQSADLGRMEFAGTGSWQVNGDSMFAKTISIEETTGNKFGGIMKSVMSLFMSKMTGTVNAYEMSENRIIFVNEENGQATLLERI